MKPIIPFGLPIGISATFWLFVGIVRLLAEKVFSKKTPHPKKKNRFKSSDIAALIPAHNEELVINRCIRALKKSLKLRQIYVVSDGSTDKTYQKAKIERCHVAQLTPGRGKAKALVYLLKRYHLYKKYKLIFIVDADTQIDRSFVKKALRLLEDPQIGVVFGSARIHWPVHILPRLGYYFIAYRERLNRILQFFYIYGQTWKYTNVNYVIPGFATIYRSDVLRKLKIDTPGILIEDFNLAFQVHRKKIAKIGYDPSMIGWDQHPDNLVDYWKQVTRWNIGFFQTIRKNGVWPSLFWLALAVFSLEVFLHSFFIILLPLVLLSLLLPSLSHIFPLADSLTMLFQTAIPYQYLTLRDIFFGMFLYDYVLTVIIGWAYRKPQFAVYGLFFFFMHYVTSLILVASLVPGFSSRSSGRWVSPKRHTHGITKSFKNTTFM